MYIEDSNRTEWDFTGPFLFPCILLGHSYLDPDPGSKAGLYAIFGSNEDFSSYTLLYVGQTGDFDSRFDDHELLQRWEKDANTKGFEFLSAYLLYTGIWNWPEWQREELEESIIQRHNPVSNKIHTNA